MAEKYSGAKNLGLEGIVACDTAVSSIINATLCYRGYTIEDLASNSSFEEVSFLLWKGRMPTKAELAEFSKAFRAKSVLSAEEKDLLRSLLKSAKKGIHPMHFLRSAVSAMALLDPDADDSSAEGNERKALRLSSKVGAIVSAFARLRDGNEIIDGRADKPVAWNFLYTLSGKEPDEEAVDVLDTALVLHADHGMNCSTFTARVTSSSLSDLYSAITSAIGALKGPLHGGANEAVLKMLDEVGSLDNVDNFVDTSLKTKRKIMGIGHRVYKSGDPRAKVLKGMSKSLTKKAGISNLFEMSEAIEKRIFDKKGLLPNVDFYSATVYRSMDIPSDLFTPIFAASRVVGWCAHVIEQLSNNRIYRPLGNYTGPVDLSWKDNQ